ncbi:MAG: P-loop NTPase [Elusimicrobiales bacterium]
MKLSDFRELGATARLSEVKRVLVVTGWKGGIGKSTVACSLAMALAKTGAETGLLDADITGACCHSILGVKPTFPQEIEGLEPRPVAGVKFMSAAFFSGGGAVALRGGDVSRSLLELLAVTQWRELDFLVIDMPPGISDAGLELLRLVPRAELVIVSVPGKLAQGALRRSLKLFGEFGAPVAGIVANAVVPGHRPAEKNLLGAIPHDPRYEAAIGNPAVIAKTRVFKAALDIAGALRRN